MLVVNVDILLEPAFVQQGDNRGEDVVNTQTFYQLTYTATYDPGTANNVYYWSDTYRMI